LPLYPVLKGAKKRTKEKAAYPRRFAAVPPSADSLRSFKQPGAAKLARLWRTQTVLALYPAVSAMLGCVKWHLKNNLSLYYMQKL